MNRFLRFGFLFGGTWAAIPGGMIISWFFKWLSGEVPKDDFFDPIFCGIFMIPGLIIMLVSLLRRNPGDKDVILPKRIKTGKNELQALRLCAEVQGSLENIKVKPHLEGFTSDAGTQMLGQY